MNNLKSLIFLCYLPLIRGGNILGIFMFPSISHQQIFQEIWRELALRGHNVTIITPNPINNKSLENLKEINVNYTYLDYHNFNMQNQSSKKRNEIQSVRVIFKVVNHLLGKLLEDKQVLDVILNDEKFDLILVQMTSPFWYALGEKFRAPVIGFFTTTPLGVMYQSFGNPHHPILNVEPLYKKPYEILNWWDKLELFKSYIEVNCFYCFEEFARADGMIKKIFGKEFPYAGQLEQNGTMAIINRNIFIHNVRPNLPSVLDIDSLHIKPAKELPKDLQEVLDKSEGAVYISFGSNIKSSSFGEALRNIILEAISELPYIVVWKWENDSLSGKPENLVTYKWLPQLDLLAHPKIKVFVTHAGHQSIDEAIDRAVPMVAIPFAIDQPKNAAQIEKLEIGVMLDHFKLTKPVLKEAILKVANEEKYRRHIKRISEIYKDKVASGLNLTVFWIEFIMRHKNSDYLQSRVIGWFEFLLLDVLLLVGMFLGLFLCFVYQIIKKIIRC